MFFEGPALNELGYEVHFLVFVEYTYKAENVLVSDGSKDFHLFQKICVGVLVIGVVVELFEHHNFMRISVAYFVFGSKQGSLQKLQYDGLRRIST